LEKYGIEATLMRVTPREKAWRIKGGVQVKGFAAADSGTRACRIEPSETARKNRFEAKDTATTWRLVLGRLGIIGRMHCVCNEGCRSLRRSSSLAGSGL